MCKVAQNLFSRKLCSWLNFLLNGWIKVASDGVLHYDVDFIVLSEGLIEGHDSWALQHAQELDLIICVFLVFFWHKSEVYLL